MLLLDAPPASVNVLIADDDTPLRADLRLMLEVHGYTCAEAADGREAVAAAKRLRPQCLLLDLAMPGLDGLAVARRLRADPLTRTIHIHCLTGSTDPVARKRAMEIGCETWLTKPVAADEVLGVVRQGVTLRQVSWVPGLSKSEAQDLLDWLERQGCTQLQLQLQGGLFAVGCLCPEGYRLEQLQGTVQLVQA